MNLKRCVDGLEFQGLVRSDEVATDRRQRALFLTSTGGVLASEVEIRVRDQQHGLLNTLTIDERDTVERGISLLERQLGLGSTNSRRDHSADDPFFDFPEVQERNDQRVSSLTKEE
jgi:hypothetical protein